MNLRKPQWTPEEVAVLNQRLLDAEAALTERDRDRALYATALDRVTIERDEALRQAAAMREVILKARPFLSELSRCGNSEAESVLAMLHKALSSNAGKDFIPRSDLEAIQKREAAMREALLSCFVTHDHPSCRGLRYCPRCGSAKEHTKECQVGQALASDAGRDFVLLSDVDPLLTELRGWEYESAQELVKAWDAKHPKI